MANLAVGDVFRVQICVLSTSLPRRARIITSYAVTATAGASVTLAAAAIRVGVAWSAFLSTFAATNLTIQGVKYEMLLGTGGAPGTTNLGFTWGGPSGPFGHRLCTRIWLRCGLGNKRDGRVFVPFIPSAYVTWGDRPSPTLAMQTLVNANFPTIVNPLVVTPGPNQATVVLGVWDRANQIHTPIVSAELDLLLRWQRRRGPWWRELPYP